MAMTKNYFKTIVDPRLLGPPTLVSVPWNDFTAAAILNSAPTLCLVLAVPANTALKTLAQIPDCCM